MKLTAAGASLTQAGTIGMTHQENKPTCGQRSNNKTDNLVVSVIVIIKTKAKSPNQKIDYFRFTPGEGFCVRALCVWTEVCCVPGLSSLSAPAS